MSHIKTLSMKQIFIKRIFALSIILISVPSVSFAQYEIKHADPSFWWAGMENPRLTLTFHGKNLAVLNPVASYPGITVETITRTENPNYLFVTLLLDHAVQPGKVKIEFYKDKKPVLTHFFEIKQRASGSANRSSFGPQDVVYLLMPDRFANGNINNDQVDALTEKTERSNPNGRHGGDIQGIIDHLDYLKDLGITSIWTTPVLEDNLPVYSYHTYAITDLYKIDARYGSNEDYVRLAEECHKRGIKLIMDMVPNHCGSLHWWMNDLPMKDWVHQFPEFTRTNYIMSTWNDPHAATSDRELNEKGWFDYTMPDLNQNNSLLLTYLKQNTIFWVEYAKLDGIRVDTYPYSDKWKVAEWTRAIREEYPNLNIMGECWQHHPSEIAYWQTGVRNYDQYDSYLPTVMDFPLLDVFQSVFQDPGGAFRLYNNYVTDYLYADWNNILVLLENHDTQRFSEQIGFDIEKYKLAVTHLLTTRGIPQLYSGIEIMMGGQKSQGDGDIRRDFPGGWPGDMRNAFTAEGRTPAENEAFNYLRLLLNYRKENSVLHHGKMIQYIPQQNVYVYFRTNEQKTVMVIMNLSDTEQPISIARYDENLKGARKAKDVISGRILNINDLKLKGHDAFVLEIVNEH